jgi:hypothetical protein
MSIGTMPREAVHFGRGAQSFVLLILAQGRSYGYGIRQRLEDDFDYLPAADPGALYRLSCARAPSGWSARRAASSASSKSSRR